MEDTNEDVFKEGGIDIREIAAETRKLEKQFKEREREREKRDKERQDREERDKERDKEREILDRIKFLTGERNKLWKKVQDQEIDKRERIKYLRDIEILNNLIHGELEDTEDEDDEFYKGEVGKEDSENKRDDDSGEDSAGFCEPGSSLVVGSASGGSISELRLLLA